jgi:DNA-binding transcriptional LysR family regulator
MQPSKIDLNLLPVFDALMQERKVVAAAARLGLSAPAVSNALARLRRHTGDALFVRTPQGMVPTPHALALATRVGPALQSIADGLARPRSFSAASDSREFCVAMTDIGEIVFLPRLVQALQVQAPKLRLRTVRNAAPQIAGQALEHTRNDMARGLVDLAVGWLPDLHAGFHQRRLFEQRYVCVMAAQHPLARGRLTLARYVAARHLLVAAPGTGHERIEALLRQHGVQRVSPLAVPHFVAVPWLVAGSQLLATVPHQLAVATAPALGLVVRELPLALPAFEVNLFWHERLHADPAHRWLRELWARLFAQAPVRLAKNTGK